jgi:ribosome-associated protein
MMDSQTDNTAVTDDQLVVNRHIRVPTTEFTFEYIRSSGPGGQRVNKVSTKARLRWPVAQSPSLDEGVKQRFLEKHRRRITSDGELLITSQRYRDQRKNAGDCLEKLRELLAEVAAPPKPRKKRKIPRAVKERRLAEKRQRAERKEHRRRPRFGE